MADCVGDGVAKDARVKAIAGYCCSTLKVCCLSFMLCIYDHSIHSNLKAIFSSSNFTTYSLTIALANSFLLVAFTYHGMVVPCI